MRLTALAPLYFSKKTEGPHSEAVPLNHERRRQTSLQKGGVPATPSGTATLLRLSPNYRFRPSTLLAVTCFRRPRLSWLDGRCVQGPGTHSPWHADPELLAIPTSRSRVADSCPDWDAFFEIGSASRPRFPLYAPL